MHETNARIISARLGAGEWSHGIFTVSLAAAAGDTTFVMPGYNLNGPMAPYFIKAVLGVAGVDEWTDVVGSFVRLRVEGTQIMALGHIVNDYWLIPDNMAADFATA